MTDNRVCAPVDRRLYFLTLDAGLEHRLGMFGACHGHACDKPSIGYDLRAVGLEISTPINRLTTAFVLHPIAVVLALGTIGFGMTTKCATQLPRLCATLPRRLVAMVANHGGPIAFALALTATICEGLVFLKVTRSLDAHFEELSYSLGPAGGLVAAGTACLWGASAATHELFRNPKVLWRYTRDGLRGAFILIAQAAVAVDRYARKRGNTAASPQIEKVSV